MKGSRDTSVSKFQNTMMGGSWWRIFKLIFLGPGHGGLIGLGPNSLYTDLPVTLPQGSGAASVSKTRRRACGSKRRRPGRESVGLRLRLTQGRDLRRKSRYFSDRAY